MRTVPTFAQRSPRRSCTVSFAPARGPITVPRSTPPNVGASRARTGAAPSRRPRRRSAPARPRRLIAVKYAQVSKSPSRARSVAPSTGVRPREPTTSARHDPRRHAALGHPDALERALDERAELASPPSAIVSFVVQRWRGETLSNSSSTDCSHGFGSRAQRRVLDRLGAPARGREEVGDDRLALVGDDLAARVGDGRVGRRGLDPDALVDLRARVGVVVERRALGRRDRVRAGRDRLRLQRLGRPRRRRLGGHDALQVVVERDDVGHVEAGEHGRRELEHAAVAAVAAERRHAAVARDLQRRGERRQPLAAARTGRPATARAA